MVGNILVMIILVAIFGGAIAYIIKSKKSGKKCIGCPGGCTCSKAGSCSGACGSCNH